MVQKSAKNLSTSNITSKIIPAIDVSSSLEQYKSHLLELPIQTVRTIQGNKPLAVMFMSLFNLKVFQTIEITAIHTQIHTNVETKTTAVEIFYFIGTTSPIKPTI